MRQWASRSGVTVRGSTSMETSESGVRRNAAASAVITRVSSASDRKVGDPPPKWSCDTGRPEPSDSSTRASSASRASRYPPAHSWCRVMILLQPQ